MPVIVAICGSFYQDVAVHRWENVNNYPSGISHKHTHADSRSLQKISACAVTHTHTYTQLFGGHSGVQIQSEV